MRITLEELTSRWKGSRATFEIYLPDDERHLWAYEGILDGPYLGDGGGVGFMLGSRVIEGDVAVEGPLIDFSLATGSSTAIVGEGYVELLAAELPILADVRGSGASWEALCDDQRAARCRLVLLAESAAVTARCDERSWP